LTPHGEVVSGSHAASHDVGWTALTNAWSHRRWV
jgi:hypothetical protein